jgi:hypothetical protein
MLSPYYYHQTLLKLTTAFGSLFNDIFIVRFDKNNDEVERIKIPIIYGPKEKYFAKNLQDDDLHRKIAIELPRMSFQRTDISYDPQRKIIRTHQNQKVIPNQLKKTQFSPVPYDVVYDLNIMVKNQIDGDQIVEQILPFFTPSFDVTINPIPDMDYQDDIPVILNSVSQEDSYDGEFLDRRIITWKLNFTMKANFYGPIQEITPIKKTQIDILIPEGADEITREVMAKTPRVQRFTGRPDPLNTVPDENGDFGYSVEFEEFNDGLKWNPKTGNDEEIE